MDTNAADVGVVELVAHHALLNGFDPIEAARRFAILQAVERHTRAWVDAGRPPLPADPSTETVDSLRALRRERMFRR